MSKPVNTIEMLESELNTAVQTYLNEHVFREPIMVQKIQIDGYGDAQRSVKVTLTEPPTEADGPAA